MTFVVAASFDFSLSSECVATAPQPTETIPFLQILLAEMLLEFELHLSCPLQILVKKRSNVNGFLMTCFGLMSVVL
jgi:hypothetical protein